METVSATRRVRRTVRVAAVLVAGHALLGALIGWLTFGFAAPAARSGGQAADRLGAPPPRTASPYPRPSRDATVTAQRYGGPALRAVAARPTDSTATPAATTPGALAGGPAAVPSPPSSSRSPLPAKPVPSASAAVPTPPAPSTSAVVPAATAPATPSPTVPASSAAVTATASAGGGPCRPEGTFGQAGDGAVPPCP